MKRKSSMRKRAGVLLMALTLIVTAFTGCGDATGGSDNEGSKPANLPTVGIVQIVEHPSLDTIRMSFLAQLAQEGFIDGETVNIDYQSAQNDQTTLKTICQKFSTSKYDLIIAIATPSAQAALGETRTIPIIFSAVTDPLAAELVDTLEAPGGNVTGTSDAVSAEMIMDLALEITPDIKTIGALYNSGETNSRSVVDDLKAYAKANGLKVIEAPVMNGSEVQQSAAYLAEKADAVFSPIDNTIASAMPIVTQTLNKAKVPFYVGADSMVNDGGLATYGINYEVLGQETAKMAAAVLDGTDPGTIPVMTMQDMNIYINLETAKELGITFPQEILDKAVVLGES